MTAIPLNKLIPSKLNVRKTHGNDGIAQLAANIHALGLLQNLQVQASGDKYEVIAGGRRLAALQMPAKEGKIASDTLIECQIQAGDNASEISLAENTIREDMHPADQFEAFKELADAGLSDADIAARFGMAEKHVKQMLRLAIVSPKLVAEYRADKLTLEQLMAFTLTSDQKRQEKVWKELQSWQRNANGIRNALTEKHINSSDSRVQFVGLDAYTAAGGKIVNDLFSEEDAAYLADVDLVNKLVGEKIEAEAERLRGEGWSWVEIVQAQKWEATRGMDELAGC